MRMDKKQFHDFTIMLNEAMMKIARDDSYFLNMKQFFNLTIRLNSDYKQRLSELNEIKRQFTDFI